MTSIEKLAHIQRLIEQKSAMEEWFAGLEKTFRCDADCPAAQTPWKLFDTYLATVAQLIGDQSEWLAWFIWENDCGRKGLSAGPNDAMRPIRTAEDVLWLID